MTTESIAFLDSGVGGLPYLAHARQRLPKYRFVYAADRENFPYGEKDAARIIEAASAFTGRLIAREHPRLVVVACNTMSVVALAALRARFPLPFIGVVPAVKPAAALSRRRHPESAASRRRVGILATRQTVEGRYFRDLIEAHANGCSVVSLPSADLVEFVECELFTASEQERAERARREVERFRGEHIDALVLGCTHFLHLEAEFRRLLAEEGIALVDSRDGVTRQLSRLLAAGPDGTGCGDGDLLYLTGTAPIEPRYGWFAARYGLRLGGIL